MDLDQPNVESRVKWLLSQPEDENTWSKIDSVLSEFLSSDDSASNEIMRLALRSALSERTRLSGTALDVIKKYADSTNYFSYLPTLLKIVNKPNKLFYTRATACILFLSKYFSLKDLRNITIFSKDALLSLNKNVRTCIYSFLLEITKSNAVFSEFKAIFENGVSDSHPDCRNVCKNALQIIESLRNAQNAAVLKLENYKSNESTTEKCENPKAEIAVESVTRKNDFDIQKIINSYNFKKYNPTKYGKSKKKAKQNKKVIQNKDSISTNRSDFQIKNETCLEIKDEKGLQNVENIDTNRPNLQNLKNSLVSAESRINTDFRPNYKFDTMKTNKIAQKLTGNPTILNEVEVCNLYAYSEKKYQKSIPLYKGIHGSIQLTEVEGKPSQVFSNRIDPANDHVSGNPNDKYLPDSGLLALKIKKTSCMSRKADKDGDLPVDIVECSGSTVDLMHRTQKCQLKYESNMIQNSRFSENPQKQSKGNLDLLKAYENPENKRDIDPSAIRDRSRSFKNLKNKNFAGSEMDKYYDGQLEVQRSPVDLPSMHKNFKTNFSSETEKNGNEKDHAHIDNQIDNQAHRDKKVGFNGLLANNIPKTNNISISSTLSQTQTNPQSSSRKKFNLNNELYITTNIIKNDVKFDETYYDTQNNGARGNCENLQYVDSIQPHVIIQNFSTKKDLERIQPKRPTTDVFQKIETKHAPGQLQNMNNNAETNIKKIAPNDPKPIENFKKVTEVMKHAMIPASLNNNRINQISEFSNNFLRYSETQLSSSQKSSAKYNESNKKLTLNIKRASSPIKQIPNPISSGNTDPLLSEPTQNQMSPGHTQQIYGLLSPNNYMSRQNLPDYDIISSNKFQSSHKTPKTGFMTFENPVWNLRSPSERAPCLKKTILNQHVSQAGFSIFNEATVDQSTCNSQFPASAESGFKIDEAFNHSSRQNLIHDQKTPDSNLTFDDYRLFVSNGNSGSKHTQTDEMSPKFTNVDKERVARTTIQLENKIQANSKEKPVHIENNDGSVISTNNLVSPTDTTFKDSKEPLKVVLATNTSFKHQNLNYSDQNDSTTNHIRHKKLANDLYDNNEDRFLNEIESPNDMFTDDRCSLWNDTESPVPIQRKSALDILEFDNSDQILHKHNKDSPLVTLPNTINESATLTESIRNHSSYCNDSILISSSMRINHDNILKISKRHEGFSYSEDKHDYFNISSQSGEQDIIDSDKNTFYRSKNRDDEVTSTQNLCDLQSDMDNRENRGPLVKSLDENNIKEVQLINKSYLESETCESLCRNTNEIVDPNFMKNENILVPRKENSPASIDSSAHADIFENADLSIAPFLSVEDNVAVQAEISFKNDIKLQRGIHNEIPLVKGLKNENKSHISFPSGIKSHSDALNEIQMNILVSHNSDSQNITGSIIDTQEHPHINTANLYEKTDSSSPRKQRQNSNMLLGTTCKSFSVNSSIQTEIKTAASISNPFTRSLPRSKMSTCVNSKLSTNTYKDDTIENECLLKAAKLDIQVINEDYAKRPVETINIKEDSQSYLDVHELSNPQKYTERYLDGEVGLENKPINPSTVEFSKLEQTPTPSSIVEISKSENIDIKPFAVDLSKSVITPIKPSVLDFSMPEHVITPSHDFEEPKAEHTPSNGNGPENTLNHGYFSTQLLSLNPILKHLPEYKSDPTHPSQHKFTKYDSAPTVSSQSEPLLKGTYETHHIFESTPNLLSLIPGKGNSQNIGASNIEHSENRIACKNFQDEAKNVECSQNIIANEDAKNLNTSLNSDLKKPEKAQGKTELSFFQKLYEKGNKNLLHRKITDIKNITKKVSSRINPKMTDSNFYQFDKRRLNENSRHGDMFYKDTSIKKFTNRNSDPEDLLNEHKSITDILGRNTSTKNNPELDTFYENFLCKNNYNSTHSLKHKKGTYKHKKSVLSANRRFKTSFQRKRRAITKPDFDKRALTKNLNEDESMVYSDSHNGSDDYVINVPNRYQPCPDLNAKMDLNKDIDEVKCTEFISGNINCQQDHVLKDRESGNRGSLHQTNNDLSDDVLSQSSNEARFSKNTDPERGPEEMKQEHISHDNQGKTFKSRIVDQKAVDQERMKQENQCQISSGFSRNNPKPGNFILHNSTVEQTTQTNTSKNENRNYKYSENLRTPDSRDIYDRLYSMNKKLPKTAKISKTKKNHMQKYFIKNQNTTKNSPAPKIIKSNIPTGRSPTRGGCINNEPISYDKKDLNPYIITNYNKPSLGNIFESESKSNTKSGDLIQQNEFTMNKNHEFKQNFKLNESHTVKKDNWNDDDLSNKTRRSRRFLRSKEDDKYSISNIFRKNQNSANNENINEEKIHYTEKTLGLENIKGSKRPIEILKKNINFPESSKPLLEVMEIRKVHVNIIDFEKRLLKRDSLDTKIEIDKQPELMDLKSQEICQSHIQTEINMVNNIKQSESQYINELKNFYTIQNHSNSQKNSNNDEGSRSCSFEKVEKIMSDDSLLRILKLGMIQGTGNINENNKSLHRENAQIFYNQVQNSGPKHIETAQMRAGCLNTFNTEENNPDKSCSGWIKDGNFHPENNKFNGSKKLDFNLFESGKHKSEKSKGNKTENSNPYPISDNHPKLESILHNKYKQSKATQNVDCDSEPKNTYQKNTLATQTRCIFNQSQKSIELERAFSQSKLNNPQDSENDNLKSRTFIDVEIKQTFDKNAFSNTFSSNENIHPNLKSGKSIVKTTMVGSCADLKHKKFHNSNSVKENSVKMCRSFIDFVNKENELIEAVNKSLSLTLSDTNTGNSTPVLIKNKISESRLDEENRRRVENGFLNNLNKEKSNSEILTSNIENSNQNQDHFCIVNQKSHVVSKRLNDELNLDISNKINSSRDSHHSNRYQDYSHTTNQYHPNDNTKVQDLTEKNLVWNSHQPNFNQNNLNPNSEISIFENSLLDSDNFAYDFETLNFSNKSISKKDYSSHTQLNSPDENPASQSVKSAYGILDDIKALDTEDISMADAKTLKKYPSLLDQNHEISGEVQKFSNKKNLKVNTTFKDVEVKKKADFLSKTYEYPSSYDIYPIRDVFQPRQHDSAYFNHEIGGKNKHSKTDHIYKHDDRININDFAMNRLESIQTQSRCGIEKISLDNHIKMKKSFHEENRHNQPLNDSSDPEGYYKVGYQNGGYLDVFQGPVEPFDRKVTDSMSKKISIDKNKQVKNHSHLAKTFHSMDILQMKDIDAESSQNLTVSNIENKYKDLITPVLPIFFHSSTNKFTLDDSKKPHFFLSKKTGRNRLSTSFHQSNYRKDVSETTSLSESHVYKIHSLFNNEDINKSFSKMSINTATSEKENRIQRLSPEYLQPELILINNRNFEHSEKKPYPSKNPAETFSIVKTQIYSDDNPKDKLKSQVVYWGTNVVSHSPETQERANELKNTTNRGSYLNSSEIQGVNTLFKSKKIESKSDLVEENFIWMDNIQVKLTNSDFKIIQSNYEDNKDNFLNLSDNQGALNSCETKQIQLIPNISHKSFQSMRNHHQNSSIRTYYKNKINSFLDSFFKVKSPSKSKRHTHLTNSQDIDLKSNKHAEIDSYICENQNRGKKESDIAKSSLIYIENLENSLENTIDVDKEPYSSHNITPNNNEYLSCHSTRSDHEHFDFKNVNDKNEYVSLESSQRSQIQNYAINKNYIQQIHSKSFEFLDVNSFVNREICKLSNSFTCLQKHHRFKELKGISENFCNKITDRCSAGYFASPQKTPTSKTGLSKLENNYIAKTKKIPFGTGIESDQTTEHHSNQTKKTTDFSTEIKSFSSSGEIIEAFPVQGEMDHLHNKISAEKMIENANRTLGSQISPSKDDKERFGVFFEPQQIITSEKKYNLSMNYLIPPSNSAGIDLYTQIPQHSSLYAKKNFAVSPNQTNSVSENPTNPHVIHDEKLFLPLKTRLRHQQIRNDQNHSFLFDTSPNIDSLGRSKQLQTFKSSSKKNSVEKKRSNSLKSYMYCDKKNSCCVSICQSDGNIFENSNFNTLPTKNELIRSGPALKPTRTDKKGLDLSLVYNFDLFSINLGHKQQLNDNLENHQKSQFDDESLQENE